MGGNDEKGISLYLLICNITSTPPMIIHLVPESHGAYYLQGTFAAEPVSLLQIPLTVTWQ